MEQPRFHPLLCPTGRVLRAEDWPVEWRETKEGGLAGLATWIEEALEYWVAPSWEHTPS